MNLTPRQDLCSGLLVRTRVIREKRRMLEESNRVPFQVFLREYHQRNLSELASRGHEHISCDREGHC